MQITQINHPECEMDHKFYIFTDHLVGL